MLRKGGPRTLVSGAIEKGNRVRYPAVRYDRGATVMTNVKPIPTDKKARFEFCAEFLAMAERELAAFRSAVNQTFGSGEAQQSVEDWLQRLEALEWRPDGAAPDWHQVTIAAASRLAARMRTAPEKARIAC